MSPIQAFAPCSNRPGTRRGGGRGRPAALLDHETRDFPVRRRAQLVNTIGAHLSEFGLVVAKAIHNVERLLAALRVVLTDATSVSRQIRSRAGVLAGALAVPPGGLRRPPRELRRQILGGVCMGFA